MTNEIFPMTPACHEKMKRELKHIREVERMENIKDIETALAHGDLRENAEYHAAKERQAALDARMRYLEFRLAKAQIIDPTTIHSEKVGFGATVKLLDLDSDEEITYAIVGEDESDANHGRVSIVSPIARALIGKSEGDEITVRLPKGDRQFEVVEVSYLALQM